MQLNQFIFSNKFLYRLSRHLAFWLTRLVVGMLQVISSVYEQGNSILEYIKMPFIHVLLGIVIGEIPYCYFVIYFLRPVFLSKKNYRSFIVSFIITTVLNLMIAVAYSYWWQRLTGTVTPNILNMAWHYLSASVLSYSLAGCGIFLTIKLFKTWYLKEQEKQMLIKANAAAETELLKAQ